MAKDSILLPYEAGQDNRKTFSFALEFAKKINSDIIILATYDIPFGNILSEEMLEKAVEKEKEKIYCSILELKGFYHEQFNLWESFNSIKIKLRVSGSRLKHNISSIINNEDVSFILLPKEYNYKGGWLTEMISELFLNNTSIITLPTNRDFYVTVPNLEKEIFKAQKESLFEQMLMGTEIYNMPVDTHLYKQEMMLASC